jgi:hypothetical protein
LIPLVNDGCETAQRRAAFVKLFCSHTARKYSIWLSVIDALIWQVRSECVGPDESGKLPLRWFRRAGLQGLPLIPLDPPFPAPSSLPIAKPRAAAGVSG